MNDQQNDPQVYRDQIFLQAAKQAREAAVEGLVRLGIQQDTIEFGDKTERSRRKKSDRLAAWCSLKTLVPQDDGGYSSNGYLTTITFYQRNCRSPTSPLDLVDCTVKSTMPIGSDVTELQKKRRGQFDYVQICQRVQQLRGQQEQQVQERLRQKAEQERQDLAGVYLMNRLCSALGVPRDRNDQTEYRWSQYLPRLNVSIEDPAAGQRDHRVEVKISLKDQHDGKRLSLEGIATMTRMLRDQLPREVEPACRFNFYLEISFDRLTEAQALVVIPAFKQLYDLFYPKSDDEED